MNAVEFWYSVLTNGEIEFELNPLNPKWAGGEFANLPDRVIFGQDNKGNYYLNGIPAHIEQRCKKICIEEVPTWNA